jgi:hypothetical protein
MAIGWMGPLARSAVPFLTELVRGPNPPARTTPPVENGPTPIKSPNGSRVWPGDSDTITPTQTPVPESASTEDSCRAYAAQALGRIGRAASPALPDLREAAKAAPEPVRSMAQQAIRLIQSA